MREERYPVNRSEVKLDELWRGGAILPGKVLLSWLYLFPGGAIKPRDPD